ncbi:hypothetical protein RHS04_05517 [Rhizoctonia solani]|uniref:Uncharacterized protein n=1 Tax=Rhizoctonia solani TaxID=456999 RepID=A0A8H7H9D9_9AGAM|nr:hypothetical protein RHS04_05517 [Rhizoctonia solani]
MDNTTLGINAAGNPHLFDNGFLRMLKKPPTTMVDPSGGIIDDPVLTDPPRDSSSGNTNQTAPNPVPFDAELMGLSGNRKALTFIECMRNAFESQTEDLRGQWEEAAEKLMQENIHARSPAVQARRERINKLYRTYVFHQERHLPQERFWEETTFVKHWKKFLIALITCSRGRSGGRVKVDTFKQWCSDLISLVGRNMIDSEGTRVGTKALTSGLYAQFREVSLRFCVQFELSREPPTRLWIGHLELLLIYQVAIRLSEKHGRASVLQTILGTSMVFQVGARVGSLGWSHEQYRDEGKQFMKCKDVVIERMDYGVWDAEITLMNRKGWNSSDDMARPLKYRLSAVTKTHMLWFDTPSLLLLHLMQMGALKDCKSLVDIFNYKGQFFVIEKEFLEKPLFLERTPQGLGLVDGQPASAIGMTASLNTLGRPAGFTVVNHHALRRDSATVFGILFGVQVGQLFLGHQEADSAFADSYTKGTLHLPVTEARLGLLDHKLPLHQKISLQRHRREGLVANALLNTGFHIEVSAEEVAEITGDDDSASGVSQEPAKKKGVRGNPLVILTDEQTEEVMSHPTIKPLVTRLEDLWNELYTLFPREAIRTHGGRKAEWVKSMTNKYKADPICVEHAARIAEACVIPCIIHVSNMLLQLGAEIKTVQQDRTANVRKVTRQVRVKTEKERKEAEAETPTIYTTDEVNQARSYAEKMSSSIQVPKPSEHLKDLEDMIKLPNFGEGILSDECRRILSSANLIQEIKDAEDDQENERDDCLVNEDEEDDQDGVVAPKFQDVDDLKVLDVDLVETKKEWMSRILEPLIVDGFYEQLAKEHDGKFPCLLCKSLPEELKPRTPVGNHPCQEIFPSRVGLERHQDLVHTPWFDLIQYMITEDPEVYRCPAQDCLFRDDTPTSVRAHCLKECEERASFKSICCAHEKLLEKRRQDRPTREKLQQEKRMRELMGPGIQLAQNVFEGTKKISGTSPEQALRLAQDRRIPKSRVTPHLNAIAALNERARTAIDEEGIIWDPYANRPMAMVSRELSLLSPVILCTATGSQRGIVKIDSSASLPPILLPTPCPPSSSPSLGLPVSLLPRQAPIPLPSLVYHTTIIDIMEASNLLQRNASYLLEDLEGNIVSLNAHAQHLRPYVTKPKHPPHKMDPLALEEPEPPIPGYSEEF